MSKVIAIIDRPEDCQECVFAVCKYSLPLSTYRKGYYCGLQNPENRIVEDFDYEDNVNLHNCPLSELPQKVLPDGQECFSELKYMDGWNDCIDRIMKGGAT